MSEKTKTPANQKHLPIISPLDKFWLTLCLAVIAHAVVILGVTFSPEDTTSIPYGTMQITLGQQGELESIEISGSRAVDTYTGVRHTKSNAEPLSLLPISLPKNLDEHTTLSNNEKIVALNTKIEQKLAARAQQPKQKFISAGTKGLIYNTYMEAWREKVERIGNLNYPNVAREQELSGSLILDVALQKDGSIDEIIIRQSSGKKILDDAAVRIVKLAAPYSPFPDDIRAETDILHITRTWQFLSNGAFR